ncbi:hypothetical protein [Ruegeria conchae]|uniref:hypothetical protein n=1 Tax=Ruegeria conchae TaxID=981384 RepID=UPI00023796FD|nr:hypothetical protein [Ruegeria conchae]
MDLFNNISSPKKNLLKKAADEAAQNWIWWKDDYLHDGRFRDLPVLQNYPRFRGFGADYSVFRGWSAEQCDAALGWFSIQSDPVDFNGLYSEFMKYCETHEALKKNLQRRVSLVSKLLAMWRPNEFAMWDTLAREGMRQIHGRVRGRNYRKNGASDYIAFNTDFHCLRKLWSDELNIAAMGAGGANLDGEIRYEQFSARILDNYLMNLATLKS